MEDNPHINWDLNSPLIVLENNLQYSNLESLDPEEDRPPKVRTIGHTILNNTYELCGVVYHSGVTATEGAELKAITQKARLGTHYYSKIKTPDDQWYLYDDLSPLFVPTDSTNITQEDGDPGVLFFYQRIVPLESRKMVIVSDTIIDLSLDLVDRIPSEELSRVDMMDHKIRLRFGNVIERTDFERRIRDELLFEAS
jgi:hypothetical protein